MFKKVVHFLLLPCSQATLLIEKQHGGQLSIVQKLKLKGHLSICKWCKAYQKKSVYMEELLQKNLHCERFETINERDIEQLKFKIREKIKNN